MHKDNVIKLALVYGKGVQNYMNEFPQTLVPCRTQVIRGRRSPENQYRSLESSHSTTTIGVRNGAVRSATPTRYRQHFGAKRQRVQDRTVCRHQSLYYPVKDALAGVEFQYGYRKNFRDGWSVPDYRIQFSFKYNFSFRVGG